MLNEMIFVFGCENDERALFARCAPRYGVGVRCAGEALSVQNAKGVAAGAGVSVGHRQAVDARLLEALKAQGVSYLSSRSVGLDHIDLDAAQMCGIAVESVGYSPQSVAEFAIMLMLMALRNAGAMLRRADGLDFRLDPRRALELGDLTVGVVGTGRIGKAVIGRLAGFGCKILAYDPRPSAKVHYVDLDALLGACDVVTLHLPLTEASRHLLDGARIARMRPGAILVNTARGALVDCQALADALETGHLAAAALDVVEGEEGWFYSDCQGRVPPFARLLAQPRAIVTPHAAYYTAHALSDVVAGTVEGYLQYKGGAKRWVV